MGDGLKGTAVAPENRGNSLTIALFGCPDWAQRLCDAFFGTSFGHVDPMAWGKFLNDQAMRVISRLQQRDRH